MQRNKRGVCVLSFIAIAVIVSSQANAQIFVFDFDGDSAFSRQNWQMMVMEILHRPETPSLLLAVTGL